MSQSFTGINSGNLNQTAFEKSRVAMDAYSKKLTKVERGKTIESSLGGLKAIVSGKEITDKIGKRVGPVIKEKMSRGWDNFKSQWNKKANDNLRNSLKTRAERNEADRKIKMGEAEDRVADAQDNIDDAEDALSRAEDNRDILKEEHSINEQERQLNEEQAEDEIDNAGRNALAQGATDAEAEAARQEAIENSIALKASNDTDRAAEQEDRDQADELVNKSSDDVITANQKGVDALDNQDTLGDTQELARTAEKVAIKEVPDVATGAEVGEDVGTGILEAVGEGLDDTGILAPIGLLLGATGIALGKSTRKDPSLPTQRINQNNYSFQAGIGE